MNLKAILTDLIWPRRATCMGCGSMIGCDRDDICDDCRKQLAGGVVGPMPVPKGMGLDGIAFVSRYHGAAGSLVRNLKYGSVRVLAPFMVDYMVSVIERMQISNLDMVTYVPMHPVRQRKRGFNQSELLARMIAEQIGVPCEALLERTRNAKQQARLDRTEREKNLDGSFACTRDLRGRTILLIDDVFTTGATAKECARVLRDNGAEYVYFAAFATGLKNDKRKK